MPQNQNSDPYNLDQYFPAEDDHERRAAPCASEHLPVWQQTQRIPVDLGFLCIRKAFLCTRCGRSSVFALKKNDAVQAQMQSEGEWKPDAYIDNLAHSKGWLFGPVELRGESFCYMLCPSCIQADLVRFQRLERFFLNEK